MASTRSVNRKLGLLLCCLAALGFGCDDDTAADHDADHDHTSSSGSASTAAGSGGSAGASGEHDHAGAHDTQIGPLTGATCPSAGSTLTYENFAKQFFSDYCLGCHSEKLSSAARNGAPADHNFDTYADVDLIRKHIDQMAGSGPSSTNTKMPPMNAPKKPTMEERQKLSEWIACGDPQK